MVLTTLLRGPSKRLLGSSEGSAQRGAPPSSPSESQRRSAAEAFPAGTPAAGVRTASAVDGRFLLSTGAASGSGSRCLPVRILQRSTSFNNKPQNNCLKQISAELQQILQNS